MFVLIPLLPLLNFVLIGLFGRFLGYKGTMRLTLLNMLTSFFTVIFCCWNLYAKQAESYVNCGTWISVEDFVVDYSFTLDKLSLSMLVVVLLISYIVHLYSCAYMKSDPHFSRFMSFLSLFTFFMIILVTADNFVLMFVGWEGVGLCSYLLIGFWHTRTEANKSASKAMVVNRIGDISLLFAMVLCFYIFRTTDFDGIIPQVPYIIGKTLPIFNEVKISSIICLLLIIGIVGKSAQIGLHIWLPDSMEGPTPVSALIHAATMVTAGIYLCIRLSFVFEFSSLALNLMAFLGTITSFISALVGLFQSDLKKVISYSTAAQLGYMLFLCGCSQYDLALFHLMNHAMFKALLFLAGGVLIYIYRTQDMRRISGVKIVSGFLYSILLIGTMAADGFLFFSSVESKDVVLELGSYGFLISSSVGFGFAVLSLCLTVCYNSVLLDICDGDLFGKQPIYKIDLRFIITLTIMAVMTLISNFLFYQNFMTEFYSDHIFTNLINSYKVNEDILSYYFKILLAVLFGLVNFHSCKEPNNVYVTNGCMRVVGWSLYFYVAVLVILHVLAALIGSQPIMSLTGGMIVQIYHYSPFFIIFAVVYLFSWQFKNWFDVYNMKTGLEYLINKAHFDWFVNLKISEKVVKLGYFLYKVFDKGILEILGPNGISSTAWNMIKNHKKYNSGYVYNYICLFLLGVLFIIAIIQYFF